MRVFIIQKSTAGVKKKRLSSGASHREKEVEMHLGIIRYREMYSALEAIIKLETSKTEDQVDIRKNLRLHD